MGNAKLEQIILQTIDIIASKKIASAGFNRTIQATVLSCEDASRGKYKVKYQDGVFYAYTENTSVSYTNGTTVFILVPNGDMSQTKTILGAVSKTGVDYVNAIVSQQEYNIIGNNVILDNNFSGLCSYKTKSIVLYNKDLSENIINIDNVAAKEYFSNSDSIILSANIQTNLPEEQKEQGNYGILLGLDFKDPSTEEIITRYYNLDVDTMEGNPYNFTIQTNQKQIFKIDKENFLEISTIALFVKDFPNQNQNITQNDIFISNISLTGAQVLSLESLNSYALLLKTPKGYIFTNNDIDYSYRMIESQIRIKGQSLTIDTDANVQYYWFIENTSITSRSPYYNKYGGQGWKCLNQYNVIKEAQVENDVEVAPAVYNFVPGESSLKIFKKDVLIDRVKYKCVAIYNDNVLSKEITIINTDPEYIFNMSSSLGLKFYLNKGQPTLSCMCKRRISQGYYEIVDKNNFNYLWAVINNIGNFSTITTSDQNYTVNQNRLKVKIRTITNFSTFKCSIFAKDDNNTYLGTVSLILSNLLQSESKGYSLVIHNKNQVFKYTTTGLSPTNEQLKNPIKILALDFDVYDERGESIGQEIATNCDITWKIPKTEYSLIKPNSEYTKQETDNESNNYDIYKNLISFVFDIQDNYSFYKTENQIELQVVYNGIKLSDRTEFVFIKQGEQGTNGTDFICKIIPNVISGSRLPLNPTIYYNGLETTFNWQNAGVSNGEWFKIEFWHNGSVIYTGNQYSSVSLENLPIIISKIEILHNTYMYEVADKTLINIEKNENDKYIFSFDSTNISDSNYNNWRFANIIKATVIYNNMIYYATLPINFCRMWNNMYKLEFKQNSGFNRVLYASNGINPMFDNHAPFIVNTFYKNNNNWEDVSLNQEIQYEWFFIGSVWEKRSDLSWEEIYEETNVNGSSSNKWLSLYSLNSQTTPQKNQKYVIPVDVYNGQCVTIGMACRVYTNNQIIGWILMPVHMSLNKFENSAINTWDGNKIELGEDGGMILAPQVGAGVKDSENKFTGIFMGTVKDPEEGLSKTSSIFNTFDELNEDIGLFGYSQGHRSIFLDAKTGKALFGRRGTGQIIIDPSTNQAIIQGGNYIPKDNEHNGSGMQINLSEPSINFGSENFMVNKNGILTAKGVNLSDSTYNGQSFEDYFTSVNESAYQEVNAVLANLKKQVDRQVMIWYNTGVPTKNNYPYIEWVEDNENLSYHEGDLYYDNNTQYAYRFINKGTESNPDWDWAQIQDDAVTAALQAAKDAQTSANNKRRVFTDTPKNTDEYDVGDLWVNATYIDKQTNELIYSQDVLVCQRAKTKEINFSIDDWRKASGYLDDYTLEPRVLMNKLSNDLQNNGIWMSPDLTDNKLYINARYINTGALSVSNSSGTETFYANVDTGEVRINARSLAIQGIDVDQTFNNLKTGTSNLLRGTNKQIVFDSSSQWGANGSWSVGGWRKASDLTLDRSCSYISDPPINEIKYGWTFSNSKIANNDIAQDNVPVQIGTEYTLSCYVKGTGTLHMQYGAGLYQSQGFVIPTKNKWVRIAWTFKVSNKAKYTKNGKTNIYFGNKGIGTLRICGMTLSIGNIDNGWSSATEDTIEKVDSGFTQQEIWNRLTNYGNSQGVYLENGKLYVNASMIQTGSLNANIITTGLLHDANNNCKINLDTGEIDLKVKTLQVQVLDEKTGKTGFIDMDPKHIRLASGELSWSSQNSTLTPNGKLTITGGADITGVIKNTYVYNSPNSDWSIASKVLLSRGDLIFYSDNQGYGEADITHVKQYGRVSGSGFIGNATGVTLRATGNGYFVGFGSNGSASDSWATGESYTVPFFYARKSFTIPKNNIEIASNTLHSFVPLYLHNKTIYDSVLNQPRIINPSIDKAVTEIFEFWVLYKDGKEYKKTRIKLPFKNGILVSNTDFPAKTYTGSLGGYQRSYQSNVTSYAARQIRWGLQGGGQIDAQIDA